jgi:hypothetical protein
MLWHSCQSQGAASQQSLWGRPPPVPSAPWYLVQHGQQVHGAAERLQGCQATLLIHQGRLGKQAVPVCAAGVQYSTRGQVEGRARSSKGSELGCK